MVSERPEPSPLTWMGGERRLARRVGRPMREFLAIEAASGMFLIAATVLAWCIPLLLFPAQLLDAVGFPA